MKKVIFLFLLLLCCVGIVNAKDYQRLNPRISGLIPQYSILQYYNKGYFLFDKNAKEVKMLSHDFKVLKTYQNDDWNYAAIVDDNHFVTMHRYDCGYVPGIGDGCASDFTVYDNDLNVVSTVTFPHVDRHQFIDIVGVADGTFVSKSNGQYFTVDKDLNFTLSSYDGYIPEPFYSYMDKLNFEVASDGANVDIEDVKNDYMSLFVVYSDTYEVQYFYNKNGDVLFTKNYNDHVVSTIIIDNSIINFVNGLNNDVCYYQILDFDGNVIRTNNMDDISCRFSYVYELNDGTILVTYYSDNKYYSIFDFSNYITIKTSEFGSVSYKNDYAFKDDEITLDVNANEGYKLDGINVMTAKGESLYFSGNKFYMLNDDITIEPIFVKDEKIVEDKKESSIEENDKLKEESIKKEDTVVVNPITGESITFVIVIFVVTLFISLFLKKKYKFINKI